MIALTTWLSRPLAALRARPRLLATAAILLLGFLALGAGLVFGTWRNVCRDCPSVAQIYVWEPHQSTKIFDHQGRLIAEFGVERRTRVALDDLPAHVPQAFVAIEDRRFYRHNGFDFLGIARAAVGLVMNRRIIGGGSTITQQLARHMFQEELGFEKRFERKLKELRVAMELEKVYTKEQILEAYINQVNYGRGHHGIESASRWFFGKSAMELNPAEAALLAAVINLPEVYSPFRNPERALRRRNLVLSLMVREGYLTAAEAERWKAEPLPEAPYTGDEGKIAPYFVEWIRQELDDRYGADLYRKGYRVYTTLDVEMQRRAREAMEKGWARIEGQPGYRHPKYTDVKAKKDDTASRPETPYLQGMFIAMEPQTGEIRAMIGGRDFNDSKFNRAVQALRQPGSAFKPIVFTAAIASGIPASHVIYDAPLIMEQPDGTEWRPRNFDGVFNGPVTLRDALKKSLNIVSIKLGLEVGLETVAQYARRMGIETPIPRVPAVLIGAADVVPLQLAEAYGVFATHGLRTRPRAILRVEDETGKVLWETRPEQDRVLDSLTVAIVTDMMRDVVDHGTAYTIRNPAVGNLPYEVPAAGKTGTTNDYTNVWFAGFTPDLLAVVWFGFDRPATILRNATGGVYAAPVWAEFMRSVYVGESALRPIPEPWTMPPELITLRVDRESGKLATEWCPQERAYVEYFIPGTEPTEACDVDSPGLFGVPLRGFRLDPDDSVPPASPDTQAVSAPGPDTTPATAGGAPAPRARERRR